MVTRQEHARRTREALIEAGLELAETTPLAGMSVNRVVQQAGVAKGSFFYHFGDRASYLLALHRGFHDAVLAEVRAATEGQQPGAARLWAGTAAYLDACLRRRGVRALLLEARAQPAVADEIRVRNDQVAHLCEADFGAMGRQHPLESARLWVGLVAEAALIEHDAGTRQPDLRDALREYLTLNTTQAGGGIVSVALGRSASRGYGQLAELGPAVLRNRRVDDPGRFDEVRRQRPLRLLEVLGLHVRGTGRIVAEGLDQDVLPRVVHAARPVKPQVAWLGAGRPGEFTGDLGPPVRVLGQHLELCGDEDHSASSPSDGRNTLR